MSIETNILRKIVEEIRLNAERELSHSEEVHIYITTNELNTARRIESVIDSLENKEIGL